MSNANASRAAGAEPPAYKQPDLPIDVRVRDLVSRMTLKEKVSQMVHEAAAIPRLDVPAYNWWNECLHGVARAGVATVFPQAIGLAATFNPELMHRVAVAISDEARAKHHEYVRRGVRDIYTGLTFWSPNINIFRDPRWGRGQETYGEDPYLTGRLGVAFVRGLQGDDPKYLKLVATPKHYAVHSGPELDRHHFDARVGPKDLRETYLPAFAACVREAGAVSVMGAYNRTNGEPCCGSATLLERILREEWGFAGYVVSDCGAICDFHQHHKITPGAPESAAMAVRNGCDLNCGQTYNSLLIAADQGLIDEATIDRALERLFTARFRLGEFDPPERVPYASIPYEVNDCAEHRALALETARQSIVLLKNDGDVLPLRRDLRSIAVIGPNADSLDVLLGNYYGTPSGYVTPLEGIRARVAAAGTRVYHARGGSVTSVSPTEIAEAVSAASRVEVAILCLGLSPKLEGEEGDAANSDAGGDRLHIDLPASQQQLLEAVHATSTPVVLVLTGGSAVAIRWADAHVPAILYVWYPGEEGGTAVADVLFGDYNPAGRLPVTFVKSIDDLPPFDDYAMPGRTYRYATREPLYPFGYGLSYTTFRYSNLRVSSERVTAGETLTVRVDVENTGPRDGDEVVQLYLRDEQASVPVPIRALEGVRRIALAAGRRETVEFAITPRQMALIDNDGRCRLEPGTFAVSVGGGQPGTRSESQGRGNIVRATFEVVGSPLDMPY